MQTETKKARPPVRSRAYYEAPPKAHRQFTTIEAVLADALATRGVTDLAICAAMRSEGFTVERQDRPNPVPRCKTIQHNHLTEAFV